MSYVANKPKMFRSRKLLIPAIDLKHVKIMRVSTTSENKIDLRILKDRPLL